MQSQGPPRGMLEGLALCLWTAQQAAAEIHIPSMAQQAPSGYWHAPHMALCVGAVADMGQGV